MTSHPMISESIVEPLEEYTPDESSLPAIKSSSFTRSLSKVPCHVIFVLIAAVCSVSSAGAVMKSMDHGAPVSRAGWRLQVSSAVLLPGFVYEWNTAQENVRKRWLCLNTLGVVLGSSVGLACHFGLWVLSLDHTSLPHSLLFVCTPPLIIACTSTLQGHLLSIGEKVGVCMGVCGVVLIAAGHRDLGEKDITILGDVFALMAAVAFVVYITAGSHLREWMPLYLYALPVTAGAAFWLTIAGIVLEGLHCKNISEPVCGPFAWMSEEFILPTLYLGFGPGFVGHAGINYVVKYVSPLILSMAITTEPFLGTLIGWLMGVSNPPGIFTSFGGVLLMGSTVAVRLFEDPSL